MSGEEAKDSDQFIIDCHTLLENQSDDLIQRLAKAVEIPSVSTDFVRRDSCTAMATWLVALLERYGGSARKVDIGYQETEDGTKHELPPVILAEFSSGTASERQEKPTLLVYSHYDVSAAENWSNWIHDPFKLVQSVDKKLLGRGTSCGKGPLLSWIWAASTYWQMEKDYRVNVKFMIEGMAESVSECLDEVINLERRPDGFFSDIDFVCIPKFTWHTASNPSLVTSMCASIIADLEITRNGDVLSSGDYGGLIYEPLAELVKLLGSLTDDNGRILIPGVTDISDAEVQEARKELQNVDVNLEDWRKFSHNEKLYKSEESKLQFVLNRAYRPMLSVHSVDSGHIGTHNLPLMPRKATARFLLRLGPGQDAGAVSDSCGKYLEKMFASLKSPNNFEITMRTVPEYIADTKGYAYQAAKSAIRRLYDMDAHEVRMGSSCDIASKLGDYDFELVIMPLGGPGDNVHAENECIQRANFLDGAMQCVTFLEELGRDADEDSEYSEGEATQQPTNPERLGLAARFRGLFTRS